MENSQCTPWQRLHSRLTRWLSCPFNVFRTLLRRPPNISRVPVFGCPCIAKVYRRHDTTTGAYLTPGSMNQRGVRGMHCGLADHSAGYYIWVPASGHIIVSCDVAFDKLHESSLAYGHREFHDALPTRTHSLLSPDFSALSRTGIPPTVFPTTEQSDTDGPWCPHNIMALPVTQTPLISLMN